MNKMQRDTYEEISEETTSMLFKGDCVQITVGANKMDCDGHDEISNEMKSMLFSVD